MDRDEKERTAWLKIYEKYGNYEAVDDPNLLKGIEENRIWTEYWPSSPPHQFIVNEFTLGESAYVEISGYFVFDKPYSEPPGTVQVVRVFWDDCLVCDQEDDECEACEGRGTVPTDVFPYSPESSI